MTREELKRIEDLTRQLKSELCLIENLREMARTVPAITMNDRVMSSPKNDPHPLISDITEREKQIEEKVCELGQLKIRAVELFSELKDRELTVMTLHFVKEFDWWEVAIKMDLTQNHVHQIRRRAMKKLPFE